MEDISSLHWNWHCGHWRLTCQYLCMIYENEKNESAIGYQSSLATAWTVKSVQYNKITLNSHHYCYKHFLVKRKGAKKARGGESLTLIGMSCKSKKKCSSLGQLRSKFYKTQWAWKGVKLSWLISNFTYKNVWKFFIKKSADKIQSKHPPCLMPIRVKGSRQFQLSKRYLGVHKLHD